MITELFPFLDDAPPFSWGRSDCALFVAGWVERVTGVDYAEAWRGRYRSAAGAQKQIKLHGDLAALVSSVWGKPVSMYQARRGDVVLFQADNGPTLGIHAGTAIAAAGPEAVVYLPLQKTAVVWRLGFEIPVEVV